MSRWLKVLLTSSAVVALAPATASAQEFQDCEDCPAMVEIPAGDFTRALNAEAPRQDVSVGAFAIGKYEVTVGEFAAFVEATSYEVPAGCELFNVMGPIDDPDASWRRPGSSVPDDAPAVCLTFDDANAYVDWLAETTGEPYRLPTEAEWDYAAHGEQETNLSYFLRAGLGRNDANCQDCSGFDLMGREDLLFPVPVDTYAANAYGLHVMFGNAAEWVADCHNPSYEGAPTDGTAWLEGDCDTRIVRGGGWSSFWADLAGGRPATDPGIRDNAIGFRVARDLD